MPFPDRFATPHDCPPEDALATIRAHGGPVLVDLDETLYLRNSTEDFLDCARPGLIALILLRLLDALRPWRLSGGEATRDVWRVRCIALLLPWVWLIWRRRVRALAQAHLNGPLAEALPTARTVVVTIGFEAIVQPLVAALGFADVPLVAASHRNFRDRRAGKLQLARASLGDNTISRSLVITDSAGDLPLLDACARPLRTIWPAARYRRALSGIYLPGQYLSQVKRPGERYIIRAILQEDFAFWLLASVGLFSAPLTHLTGLALLLLSFWTIYECGYVDNDLIARRYEKDPKLSAAFAEAPVATPRLQPWLWALASGALGAVLLRWPGRVTAPELLGWLGVLVATHGWFRLYNRVDKRTRVWLFPGLQFARTASFTVLVPVSPIGALALGAHVIARWVPYYQYRAAGSHWPEAPLGLSRLLFFAILCAVFAIAEGGRVLLSGTFAALIAWNVFRARQDIEQAIRGISRIDR